ncbi:hypothetical protein QJQ45_014409 [Haematococcus lacustris]|nr:hypothetical protein QJQ45_014409 [Haematococcus lacustris]
MYLSLVATDIYFQLTRQHKLLQTALCAVMISAIAVYYAFAVQLDRGSVFHAQFAPYDSISAAPARYFLPARQADPTTNNNVLFPTVAMPSTPQRWKLAADPSGLEAAGKMFERAQLLATLYVNYGVLQGVALIMLLFHGIQYISFQPRLALIARTLGAMLMDMAHFMAVYLGLLVLTAMALVLAFGCRVGLVKDLGEALNLCLQYTMLSDPTGEILFKAMLAPEVLSSLSWAEVALGISLRYLVPLLLHFTLVAGFFLAIILNPYSRLRMLASKDPGVPQDVSRMWRWQLQRMGPAKAPPNHHIDKIIDLCLLLQPVGLVQRLRSIMVMSRSNMRSFMQGPGSTPAPQALLSSLPQHGTLRLDSLNLQMPSWSGASFMRNSTDSLHDQLASLRAGSSRLEHLPSVVSDE